MPALCSRIQATDICGTECVIGFNNQMKLFINDKLFSNQCTSFHIAKSFLSFSVSTEGLSHELFNYDLNKKLPKPANRAQSATEMPLHPKLEDSNNFNVRAIERGAKIVTVDPGIRTILQMPRGNLEGIYPRIITLKQVIEDIENLKYGRAFRCLR